MDEGNTHQVNQQRNRARAVMAIAAFVITCSVVAGSVLRIGPFSAAPASAVTDPSAILAGSLQAVLDASTFHVDAELDGAIPAELAGTDRPVDLAGATAVLDVDLAAVRSRSVLRVPATGAEPLELVTVWDRAWLRTGASPWATASVADAVSASGLDLNPLTLVDRVRTWLAEDPDARVSRGADIRCAPGRCRVVTLDAGADPLVLAALLLPTERAAYLPDATVTITLHADVDTLRPVLVTMEATAPDGTLLAGVTARFSGWNDLVPIEEPDASPSAGPLSSVTAPVTSGT